MIFALLAIVRGAGMADDNASRAAAHYRQGVAFEKAGAHEQAIDEYKKAHALDRKASHLFNIARAYALKNDPRSAIPYYKRFLEGDPTSQKAKEAREALAIATKKVADEDAAKKKLDDEKAADAKKLADEKERIRVAAEARLKQAAELARAGAWASAADEYKRATEIDGDPAHLLAAADAYRKQPDLAAARAMFQRFLDVVPDGPRSDEIRSKVALLAREIENERALKAKAGTIEAHDRQKKPSRGSRARARSRGYKFMIGGLALGATAGVFAFLGGRVTRNIQEGNAGSGPDIENALATGRIYNLVAIGTSLLAIVGVTIGGVSIGLNLGPDREPRGGVMVLNLGGSR